MAPLLIAPLHSGMQVGTSRKNRQGRSLSSTRGLVVIMETGDWYWRQREERGRDAVERGPILEREPCGRSLRKQLLSYENKLKKNTTR